MTRQQPSALYFLVAALCWQTGAFGLTREVHSCKEIRNALKDTSVNHVLIIPVEGGYNCTSEDIPSGSVEIKGREVVLEGYGNDVYIDANKQSNVVLVSDGGKLSQRNFWSDDCLFAEAPFMCFARALSGGWISIEDMQVSDATCIDVKQSKSIGFLLWVLRYSTLFRGGLDHIYEGNRTLRIHDTDWMVGMPSGAKWRVLNTTFTCTGNVTHELPADYQLVEVEHIISMHNLLLVVGGLVVAMGIGLGWCARRRARDSQLPEYKLADSKGFVLEGTLGKGHFGRVYKARSKATGQLVAVKVIDLLPSQQRQVMAAWQECQLMSRVEHSCIVKIITFYSAQVQQHQQILQLASGSQYVELGYNVSSVVSAGASRPALALGPDSSSTALLPGNPQPHDGSSGQAGAGSGSGSDGLGLSGTSMPGESSKGAVLIQVQLVMQYCDMGTLDRAIKRGIFEDADTGQPKLRHILATALEVAQGLEYLHHPDRRMVHRDLSAANVLLTTHTDERGFRALVSDFGLSTSLVNDATHKTSEVKGTISYMSPELFMRDDVSPALDIYSLGIILYMLHCGKDPYIGQTPAMIILSKVRANEHADEARLPLLEGCSEAYQQLVWDCTHCDRRKRPTAADVVGRIAALLLQASM